MWVISNDAFTVAADEDWPKHLLTCNFSFFKEHCCFQKTLEAYLYDQSAMSEDDAANGLVTFYLLIGVPLTKILEESICTI